MNMLPSISIIIPNFNGEHHLKEFLLENIQAAKNYKGTTEIVVCDDHSTDNSLQYLKEIAKDESILTICINPKKGLCSARNHGTHISSGRYILYIDNDFLLEKNALNLLAKHIEIDTFCIACCIYSYYEMDKQQDGVKLLDWKRGYPRFTRNILNNKLPSCFTAIPSFGIQGAGFLCSKEKLLQLNGFDDILLDPYMLDETDFFYRGLKRGWKITYAPELLGWHKIGGTIASKVNPYTKFLSKRNRFIFVWKNIHDWKLIRWHILFLPVIIFKPIELKAFFAAIRLRSQILCARKIERENKVVSDLELLKQSKAFERLICK